MPAIPPLPQRLSDGVVALRFTTERDIPEILIAYQEDPLLHVRMSHQRPPSGAELGRALEQAEPERQTGTRASLTIIQPPDQDCRGLVSVHTIEWQQGRAELGVWVAPRHRGRGIARRALGLTAAWLFEAGRLERLELFTDTDNAAMLCAGAAAGFVQEGVLRAYRPGPDGRRDMVAMSLLPGDRESPSDPPVREAAHMREQAR